MCNRVDREGESMRLRLYHPVSVALLLVAIVLLGVDLCAGVRADLRIAEEQRAAALARATEHTFGLVIEVQAGKLARVRVTWYDVNHTAYTQWFSGRGLATGDRPAIAYEPASPHSANIDDPRFVPPDAGPGLWFFAVCGLGLGGLAVVAWCVRLGQWALASVGPAEPMTAQAYEGRDLGAPPQRDSTWLVLRDGTGRRWYQRVAYQPWLPDLSRPTPVRARRGPGPSFLVDVSGHGRLWPMARARDTRPLGRMRRLRPHPGAPSYPVGCLLLLAAAGALTAAGWSQIQDSGVALLFSAYASGLCAAGMLWFLPPRTPSRGARH
jgi:hypothetical protein